MDNIKSKVLDLIQPKGNKIPLVGNYEDINFDDSKKTPEKLQTDDVNLPSDQEILDTIENCYFQACYEFDPTRYELEKFESFEDKECLEQTLYKLRQQHNVVSNQVLQMILEKQNSSQNEFQRVCCLEKMVGSTREVVRVARDSLAQAISSITYTGLAVVRDSRRRFIIKQLLSYLHSVASLRKMELLGESKLECGDVTGAIRLFVDCLKEAGSFKYLDSVSGLISRLQDSLVMAEEHLDLAIANLCYNFDQDIFLAVESGYSILGKSQMVDQILMHYTSAIRNSAHSTIASFLDEATASQAKDDFSQLCQLVNEENFINCLTALCKNLWSILLSYHQLVCWYAAKNQQSQNDGEIQNDYFQENSKQKLEGGMVRLWHDVQNKVSALVLSTSLANYKFDDFLHFLAILHRVSQIGEEACGERKDFGLAGFIRAQSLDYFSKYHLSRMDDLADILDNEPWTPCPVRHHFNLLYLQEWRGLRYAVERCTDITRSPPSDSGASLETSSVSSGRSWFSHYPDPTLATPFDGESFSSPRTENILLEDSDLGKDYSSEDSDDETNSKSGSKLVSNTTLTILRLCGKYLQMAKYLGSIVEEVVLAVCQLFDYYLYSIYKMFTQDPFKDQIPFSLVPSIKLQAVLKRIRETLFEGEDENSFRVRETQGAMIDFSKDMSALESRIVGVESLVFLSEQYLLLKAFLQNLLYNCNSSLHKLDQFYIQNVGVCTEVRGPAYWPSVCASISVHSTISCMQRVDWELKEVMSQHNAYVDQIFNEVVKFSSKLEKITIEGGPGIPKVVINSLWDSLSFLLANLFVEGFSSSRKCSNGGRGLMQLDWAQLQSKISQICPLHPTPYVQFVERYIKAYYQPEPELLSWIKQYYRDYSEKQLAALICSACQSERKSRTRLLAALDEIKTGNLDSTAIQTVSYR